jgi:YVTN family beta-propeller protein
MYEPYSGKLITCNGRSKDLTVIDPIEEKVVATIPVGGKPETAVSDNKGKLYVNVEDKNEIAVIDLKSMKMIDHWSLLPAEEPTGLAIDTKSGLLFAGCDKKLAIIKTETGKVDKIIEIGEGCDGVAYDPELKTVFTSNGSGTMSIIIGNNKGEFNLSQTLNTKKGARTICIDPSTHIVYSPTAEFEAQEANDRSRPKMIAGSFQILVIK